MSETEVALDLFLHWLAHAHGRRPAHAELTDGGGVVTDGEARVAVQVRSLLPVEDADWGRRRQQLQGALSEGLPGRYALWVPAGADLPREEPATSEFIELFRTSAVRLGPRERSFLPVPIKLRLRKVSDEGGVVTASGGLNPHWARFTEHVSGTYDLDSRQLHRLPESGEHLQELLDFIIARSKEMAPGDIFEIQTIDAWTLQRLDPPMTEVNFKPGGPGEVAGADAVAVIGAPPGNPEDQGLAVRRNFRRLLAEAGPGLRDAGVALTALVLVGYYPRMDAEGASTAMRGYDPGLYAGIDFICLVADGLVKPLIEPRRPSS
jgi:hypothetical protein